MKKIINTLLLILVLFSAQKVQSQIDTLFWFAAPWVTPDHDGNTQMAFRISTFGNASTVRIQQPALTYDTTFVVPANSLASISLNHLVNDIESMPADAILTTGLKITSDELITVVYDFISDMFVITPGTPNNPETYSLKGQNGMGNEFVVPFQTRWNNRVLTVDRNGDGDRYPAETVFFNCSYRRQYSCLYNPENKCCWWTSSERYLLCNTPTCRECIHL
jgi:hypothetical protein